MRNLKRVTNNMKNKSFFTLSFLTFSLTSHFALAMNEACAEEKTKTSSYFPIEVKEETIVPMVPIVSRLNLSDGNLMLRNNSPKLSFSQTDESVQLIKGYQRNPITNKGRDCYQFVDGKQIFPVCMSSPTIITHFDTTKETYDAAITKLTNNAYRSLKPLIGKVEKDVVDSLLYNYLDPSNNESEINVTGSELSEQEFLDIKHYMDLCRNVYTDYYTRDFHLQQKLSDVANKLDPIITAYDAVKAVESDIKAIKLSLHELANLGLTTQKTTVINHVAQTENVAQIDLNDLEKNIILKYENLISRLCGLKGVNKSYLKDKLTLKAGQKVQEILTEVEGELQPIKASVTEEYGLYFETEDSELNNELRVTWSDLTRWVDRKLGGKDLRAKEYNNRTITPKGAIISSFLMKSKMIDNDIRVLDVGFRNQERYGSFLNNIVTMAMFFKGNDRAFFDSWGEVDHISFIKKDPERKKDKLVLVYAGSNSQVDWGIDFTIGSIPASKGLSVHAGIGWMFQASIDTFHSSLLLKLKSYYASIPEDERPSSIEIDITGHSLGGGLALIAGHYYKTIAIKEIIEKTGIKDVSVRIFTYAAPAIISKNTSGKFENDLGKNNIKRTWVTNDLVPVLSAKAGIQGGCHVGKSIPLYNLDQLEKDISDLWGPHGANHYTTFIAMLQDAHPQTKQVAFIKLLNNYIKTNKLDEFKNNRKALDYVRNEFDQGHFPIYMNANLAKHLLLYSPETANFIPPKTIAEWNPDSPRSQGALSPRFIVEKDSKWIKDHNTKKDRFSIVAKFDIPSQKLLTFEIFASTDCSREAIKKFLSDKLPNYKATDEQIIKYSTGVCMAKRIFVSQYPNEVTSRYFGVPVLGKSVHQDTLTKMLAECLVENATTAEYLERIGKGRNILEQVREILGMVGLKQIFEQKEIRFDRFEDQDRLDQERTINKWQPNGNDKIWKRPGKEVPAKYYETQIKKLMLNKSDIKQLFENEIKWEFTVEGLEEEKSAIHRKIIEATMDNKHYDLLQDVLNYEMIQESLQELILRIDTHDLGVALNKINTLCELFKTNLINAANEHYRVYKTKTEKSLFTSDKLAKWSVDNLSEDLNEMFERIKRDSLWLISEEENSSCESLNNSQKIAPLQISFDGSLDK